MSILGIALWLLMPALAGYVIRHIFRWKETSQIETYLTGFFFLFFMQGVIFVPCVFLHLSFEPARMILAAFFALVLLCSFIFLLLDIKKGKFKKSPGPSSSGVTKKEKLYFIFAVTVFCLVVMRMIFSQSLLREDMTLETVRTTVATKTMFEYHPLTGQKMDAGLIASKKIITLPLLYSGIVSLTHADAWLFLNVGMGLMIYIASAFAVSLVYQKMTMFSRKNMFLLFVFYSLLILSGDYHQVTLSYKILYQGYLGETICFAVILPYLLSVVIDWYHKAGGEERLTTRERVYYMLKLLFPLMTSVFLTGLGTGLILLVLCLFIAAACCLIKSIGEVRACRKL